MKPFEEFLEMFCVCDRRGGKHAKNCPLGEASNTLKRIYNEFAALEKAIAKRNGCTPKTALCEECWIHRNYTDKEIEKQLVTTLLRMSGAQRSTVAHFGSSNVQQFDVDWSGIVPTPEKPGREPYGYTILAPDEEVIKDLREVAKLIQKLNQSAYEQGTQDAHWLLESFAKGEKSLDQFTESVKEMLKQALGKVK